MRTILLLLALAGLALASPASAQGIGQAAGILTITPPKVDLREGIPLLVDGVIEFRGDAYHALNMQGVPVEYKVTIAPEWAAVTVSPANDVISLNVNGPQVTGARPLVVSILLSDQALIGDVGTVEVTATFRPQAPGSAPFSVSAGIPVRASSEHGDDCLEHIKAQQAASTSSTSSSADTFGAPAAAPSTEEQPLYVQTGGADTTGKAWYAIAGFGLVGAGVGFVMWRRRSG